MLAAAWEQASAHAAVQHPLGRTAAPHYIHPSLPRCSNTNTNTNTSIHLPLYDDHHHQSTPTVHPSSSQRNVYKEPRKPGDTSTDRGQGTDLTGSPALGPWSSSGLNPTTHALLCFALPSLPFPLMTGGLVGEMGQQFGRRLHLGLEVTN